MFVAFERASACCVTFCGSIHRDDCGNDFRFQRYPTGTSNLVLDQLIDMTPTGFIFRALYSHNTLRVLKSLSARTDRRRVPEISDLAAARNGLQPTNLWSRQFTSSPCLW